MEETIRPAGAASAVTGRPSGPAAPSRTASAIDPLLAADVLTASFLEAVSKPELGRRYAAAGPAGAERALDIAPRA